MVQIDHLKNRLSFLQKHVSFFKLILLYKLKSNVRQLHQQQRDLILVYLDLFIIKPVEAIVLLIGRRVMSRILGQRLVGQSLRPGVAASDRPLGFQMLALRQLGRALVGGNYRR